VYSEALTREEIWDFYAACDVLLNGRRMGESFGFSIAEPLSLGKPVVGPGLIRNVRMDQHHIKLLKVPALLYSGARDLQSILERELRQQTDPDKLKNLVESFSQPLVMKRFEEVFIHENS
jgi:glycosyltransferase involved in cell wall biosynthesis